MKPYYEIPSLEYIYLEDSWVVGLNASQKDIIFKIEFVLTEKHQDYKPSLKNEQYCYKGGTLRFDNCSEIKWHSVNHTRSIDKDGQIDMGNIDTFTFCENKYFLSGDWGEVEITCKRVSLDFCSEEAKKGPESV